MPSRGPTEPEARAKQVVSDLADGAFAAVVAEFSEEYASEFVGFLPPTLEPLLRIEPGPVLQEQWRGLTSLYGEFERSRVQETTADGDSTTVVISLEFEAGTQMLRMTFGDTGTIDGFEFPSEYQPPEYVDKERFEERETVVEAGEVELGATLSIPADTGQVPGIVLVHGAGGHDRDHTVGPNKIFRDIGWGLASAGYAVLRYDKRSLVDDVPLEAHGIETLVLDDAVTALERLADVDEVDDDRLYVVGHSLGGGCTPEIAARYGDVAGIANLDGVLSESFATEYEQTIRERWSMRDDDSDYAQAQIERVNEALGRVRRGDFERDETVVGFPGAWWESVRAYNEQRIDQLSELSTPLFAVRTGRVTPDLSAESIAGITELAPDELLDVEFYEQLNHYFQEGDVPGSDLEPLLFRKPVAEPVVQDLVSWIGE